MTTGGLTFQSRRVVSLVLCLFTVFGLGCGLFDPPDKPPPPPPDPYPPLNSPQNTLLNLKLAWQSQDSLRAKLIYDDEYIGTSADQTDPGSPVLTYFKLQEVYVLEIMGKRQEINSVSFDISPEQTWVRLRHEGDPEGWATIAIPDINIQVDDIVHGLLVASDESLFEFKFKPYVNAPGDTTWRIIRWNEIRTGS